MSTIIFKGEFDGPGPSREFAEGKPAEYEIHALDLEDAHAQHVALVSAGKVDAGACYRIVFKAAGDSR